MIIELSFYLTPVNDVHSNVLLIGIHIKKNFIEISLGNGIHDHIDDRDVKTITQVAKGLIKRKNLVEALIDIIDITIVRI